MGISSFALMIVAHSDYLAGESRHLFDFRCLTNVGAASQPRTAQTLQWDSRLESRFQYQYTCPSISDRILPNLT
jgi:hypothetical protein